MRLSRHAPLNTLIHALLRAGLLGLIALAGLVPVHAEEPRLGYQALPKMDFKPPAVGSYQLPPIQPTPSGTVLDMYGKLHPLSDYTRGAVTLLSFIYTYCTDPTGCPVAYEAFVQMQKAIAAAPDLRGKVRLVSLSFDPTNDTPEVLRLYGGKLARTDGPAPWHLITTRSVVELLPLLADFGQDVSVDLDAQGKPTRTFSHLLKVFLIDARGQVREIYTTAFLIPQVMLNDMRTLLLEVPGARPILTR